MKKVNINFNLPVVFLKEKNTFVAYSPALDLSTCGKSFEEAQRRFFEISKIFFQEIIKKGTEEEVLGELGWQKINQEWSSPIMISHRQNTIKIPVSI